MICPPTDSARSDHRDPEATSHTSTGPASEYPASASHLRRWFGGTSTVGSVGSSQQRPPQRLEGVAAGRAGLRLDGQDDPTAVEAEHVPLPLLEGKVVDPPAVVEYELAEGADVHQILGVQRHPVAAGLLR